MGWLQSGLQAGRTYSFNMVISPRGNPKEKVYDMSGKFVPDKGDTIDDVRQQIIAQYLKENRRVKAREMFVVSFSYR